MAVAQDVEDKRLDGNRPPHPIQSRSSGYCCFYLTASYLCPPFPPIPLSVCHQPVVGAATFQHPPLTRHSSHMQTRPTLLLLSSFLTLPSRFSTQNSRVPAIQARLVRFQPVYPSCIADSRERRPVVRRSLVAHRRLVLLCHDVDDQPGPSGEGVGPEASARGVVVLLPQVARLLQPKARRT